MAYTDHSTTTQELERRAEALFDKDIRARVEHESPAKFLVIDVASGDYEVDDDDVAAFDRLRARRPNAEVWFRRVGSPFVHRLRARGGAEAA